ncbi:MAG: ABC transporter permease [Candidatus Limnocylindrales bacterium]
MDQATVGTIDPSAMAVQGASPYRDRAGVLREKLVTWRTAVRLGWAIESNWADPLLFLIYSVAKPVASVLMLVVMLQIVTDGAAGTAQLGFVIVGSALWSFVVGGIAGLAISVLDDRERYRMLRYLYVLPGALPLVLLGRGTARILVAAMGAAITLVAALIVVGSPIDLATIDWPYLVLAMGFGLLGVVALGATMGAIVMQTRQDSWNYPEAMAGALFLVVGAVFPLSVLPAVAQVIGLLVPLTWWMEGVRRALIPDAATSIGGPGSVWSEATGMVAPDTAWVLGALLVTTALSTLLAVVCYRWSEHRARERGAFDQTTGS